MNAPAPGRECGACTMCCSLLQIDELQKPEGVACVHVREGGGCGIYETRPGVCRAFYCLWMQHPAFDEGWKPNVCHFLLRQVDAKLLVVDVDPAYPDAWRQQPYYDQIKIWSEAVLRDGARVMVNVGPRMFGIFPEEDLDAGLKTPGGRVSMGYFREGDLRRPYVALKDENDVVIETIKGGLYRGMPDDPPHLRGDGKA
ncbi:MAG: YkgJ family cysteine cluster protein [Proteobacteria bacterium]|nr:YkgJ family cysteine cluster protein [Pseudomonadota bacterium]